QRDSGEKFIDNRYSRRHQWSFDGGISVPASSSPQHVPEPYSAADAVDPEEAFVAALSSCHMLFFLYHAARKKWTVERYEDDALGLMGKNAQGQDAIVRVTLRPRVSFSGTVPGADEVNALHEQSHHDCYLANSVRSEVLIEPRV
ncbi:MAG TPA: OsmC family protein, partial [Nevskiaceae bacterium]|nr:OsmC family protein [Nevskiaceae bacterium]